MRALRLFAPLLAVAALSAAPAAAQEAIGTGGPEQHYRPGWTLTPEFGVAYTFDDNISLFGRGTAEGVNQDYVTSYLPAVFLHYIGKHTTFESDYTGAFLAYRTFNALNRWDQHGKVEVRRQESARLKWSADLSASAMPSTDLIDLAGIPYRHVGAQMVTGRGGLEYALGEHSTLGATYTAQKVSFDRASSVAQVLRGGNVQQLLTMYRRKVNERLSFGADYSFRQSNIVDQPTPFTIHEGLGSAEYRLNPDWTMTFGGGAVYLLQTPISAGRSGPAYRIGITRHRGVSEFHVGFLQSYIPSFGYGGTVQSRELGASIRLPLGSPRLYTQHSGTFRDDVPLTAIDQQLPLRSFRSYSVIGWEPDGWLRIEAFYSRVQQTSLRAGGQLWRNRIGIQIVTSHSLRMQ